MTELREVTDDVILEILDRARRIETRLASFMEAQGMDTKVRRPVLRDGRLVVQSAATSIAECMAAIPEWHRQATDVVHHDKVICRIELPKIGRSMSDV